MLWNRRFSMSPESRPHDVIIVIKGGPTIVIIAISVLIVL